VRLDEFLRDIQSHVDLRVLGLAGKYTTNRRRMTTPEQTLVQVVGLSAHALGLLSLPFQGWIAGKSVVKWLTQRKSA
jgi:hypothetical protein